MRSLCLALPLLLASCGKSEPPPPAATEMTHAPAGAKDLVRDPVCNMMVDPAAAKYKAAHEGANYHFCAETCLKDFQADPRKYAPSCRCARAAQKCPCEHCGGSGRACECGK